MAEATTTERTFPEGVEVKPPRGEFDYQAVWVDGIAYGTRGDDMSTEELEEFAAEVRSEKVLERAEGRAKEALSRDPFTREQAELAAAFIEEHVLSALWVHGIVDDPEKLELAAWKIGYSLTPLVVAFLHLRHLERYISSTSDTSEVAGGLLADALGRVGPIIEAYRARI